MIDIHDTERREAEQAVIGSMVIDQRVISKVSSILTPDDFVSNIHRTIFEAAVDAEERGKAFDHVIAVDVARVKLDEKAAAYVLELVQATPTSANAVEYANIVKKRSDLTRLRDAVEEYLTGDDPMEMAGDIIGICQSLLQGAQQNEAYTLREALLKLYDEKVNKKKGLPTGIAKLDSRIKGMDEGDFIIIGARPGTGKSVLGADISLNVAKNGAKTILFSLEMNKVAIAERLVSRYGSLDMDTLIGSEFTPEQWKEFTDICGSLSKIPLTIMDVSGMTVPRVRAIVKSIPDIKLIVIDYLQLMTPVGKFANETYAIGSISKGLKLLARELKIPIVALSQFSRDADEYEKPKLKHLRDSGQLEQDADKVIVLWKTAEVADGLPQPIGRAVLKARRGRVGTDLAIFDGSHMRFTDTEERYEPPKPKGRSKVFE